jgi:long-chain acyl-CoA synthetase
MPQFLIAILAAWKAGDIAVPINPMNRQRELALIFQDCKPRALTCLDELYRDVVVTLGAEVTQPLIVVTTSPQSLQSWIDPRVFRAQESRRDHGETP